MFAQQVKNLNFNHFIPDLPESYKQSFDFIMKLDSLGYSGGILHLENTKNQRKQKTKTRFRELSDSTYSIRIKRDEYLLNARTGKVTDQAGGWIVYRNLRLRKLEDDRTAIRGTDKLGTFTVYFGNFQETIPSRIDYEPQTVGPNQTLEYKIRCTPTINDYDSTWNEMDTTRIFQKFDSCGNLISQRTERQSVYNLPQIIEFNYSYSSDTTIARLGHFEDGFGWNYPSGIYITTNPYKFMKTVYSSGNNKTHFYQYYESDSTRRLSRITDVEWIFEKDWVIFSTKIYKEETFLTGNTWMDIEKQVFTFRVK
jgi:hypothetical protein